MVRRPLWVDDELFPFESRFIELSGNLVHYVDEGCGPALLLLHGNPTWSFLWRDVISSLRDRFRCIALDYPGFGLSHARKDYGFRPEDHTEVVHQFVEALDLHDATLVGQDWGGMIGLAVAGRRPRTFNRLVLANTWAWPVNGIFHFEWFGRIIGGRPFAMLVRRYNVLVNWFMPAGHQRRRLSTAEFEHYRKALDTPLRRQASALFPRSVLTSAKFFAEVEAALPTVAALPTLIVWGDADIAFRLTELHRLEKCFPNHSTIVIKGAGLYTESDAPEEFVMAFDEWDAKHSTST